MATLQRPGRPDLAPPDTPGPREVALVPRPNPRQGPVPPPLAHSPRAPPRRGLPPPSERSPPRPPRPARGLGAARRRGSHVQAHALFGHWQRPGRKVTGWACWFPWRQNPAGAAAEKPPKQPGHCRPRCRRRERRKRKARAKTKTRRSKENPPWGPLPPRLPSRDSGLGAAGRRGWLIGSRPLALLEPPGPSSRCPRFRGQFPLFRNSPNACQTTAST